MLVRWKRDGQDLVSSSRVSFDGGPSRQVSPGVYQQDLAFSSLELGQLGNYSCGTTVNVSTQTKGGFSLQVEGNTDYYVVNVESEFLI